MRAILHAFSFPLLLLCCASVLTVWAWPTQTLAAPAPVSLEAAAPLAGQEKVVWGEMPAGARTVYIGIHGGTVPVSLLTAGDGSPMIAQVGLTGTDFLYFMRRGGRLNIAPEAPSAPAEKPEKAESGENAETLTTGGTSENRQTAAPAVSASVPASSSESLTGEKAVIPGEEELPPTAPVALLPGNNATLRLAGGTGSDVQVIYATGRAFEQMSLVPANWAPFGMTQKALSVEGEVKILSQPKKLPRNRRNRR